MSIARLAILKRDSRHSPHSNQSNGLNPTKSSTAFHTNGTHTQFHLLYPNNYYEISNHIVSSKCLFTLSNYAMR